jgi:hypothetical protein
MWASFHSDSVCLRESRGFSFQLLVLLPFCVVRLLINYNTTAVNFDAYDKLKMVRLRAVKSEMMVNYRFTLF